MDSSAASAPVEDSPPTHDGSEEQNPSNVLEGSGERAAQAPKKVAVQRLRSLWERSAYTLSEQLGLKVRRVVVDAGHGGHDTGAIGRGGTREKDVALAIALRLREVLGRAGLEVILTREDDTFVPLEERARRANEAKGDLFISIHCNSSPGRRLRGVETYSLNTASDRYSIRLAARENASSEKRISDLQCTGTFKIWVPNRPCFMCFLA